MGKGGNRNNQGGRGGNHGNKTRNQRRDDIERKRDERSQRNALKKEKQAAAYSNDDDDAGFRSFRNQLELQGFKMRDVVGDGNCLFRAFADQMDGNEHQHVKHRKDTVKYMEDHPDEFVPFLEETVLFADYLKNLGQRGTYGGNDSIVAFARCNGVDVVIHQLNNPTFIIEGNAAPGKKIVVHLAYHDYEHYSSVRSSCDPCSGAAYVFHKDTETMVLERNADAERKREEAHGGVVEEEVGGSRKERRKNKQKKKTNTVVVEGNTCQLNDDFVREAVEELRRKSGCDDVKYIRNVFVDNSYDVDASLSFLFQTMHLHEERKSVEKDAEDSTTSNVEVDLSKEGSPNEQTAEFERNESRKVDNVVEDEKDKANDADEDKEDDDDDDDDDDCVSCACECTDSTCDCQPTNDTDNCLDTNAATGTMKKGKSGKPTVAKHMSNRQRKELAKQERKKRRQETRKADSATHAPSTDSTAELSNSIKCINI